MEKEKKGDRPEKLLSAKETLTACPFFIFYIFLLTFLTIYSKVFGILKIEDNRRKK
jgi:hypothetical protein